MFMLQRCSLRVGLQVPGKLTDVTAYMCLCVHTDGERAGRAGRLKLDTETCETVHVPQNLTSHFHAHADTSLKFHLRQAHLRGSHQLVEAHPRG